MFSFSPEQIYVLLAMFFILAIVFCFVVYLSAKMRLEVRQAKKQLKREENIEKYREYIKDKLRQIKNSLSRPSGQK
jgi:uncharacterized membrane protein YciS (DUF1049 family)